MHLLKISIFNQLLQNPFHKIHVFKMTMNQFWDIPSCYHWDTDWTKDRILHSWNRHMLESIIFVSKCIYVVWCDHLSYSSYFLKHFIPYVENTVLTLLTNSGLFFVSDRHLENFSKHIQFHSGQWSELSLLYA